MKFRKKLADIDAVQFTPFGDNQHPVVRWIQENGWVVRGWSFSPDRVEIPTPGGRIMAARLGDWIIRDAKGEFYPCPPSFFAATYEPVCRDAEEAQP